jgi:hypothetical protein
VSATYLGIKHRAISDVSRQGVERLRIYRTSRKSPIAVLYGDDAYQRASLLYDLACESRDERALIERILQEAAQ